MRPKYFTSGRNKKYYPRPQDFAASVLRVWYRGYKFSAKRMKSGITKIMMGRTMFNEKIDAMRIILRIPRIMIESYFSGTIHDFFHLIWFSACEMDWELVGYFWSEFTAHFRIINSWHNHVNSRWATEGTQKTKMTILTLNILKF